MDKEKDKKDDKDKKSTKDQDSKEVAAKDRPILVAVDFSDDSKAAFTWACEAATAFGAPIVLFHVVHEPAEAPGYYRHDIKDKMRPMEDVAEKMMRKFLKERSDANPHNKSLKNLKTQLVTGLPVTRVLKAADKVNARMIVMGSQGRSGLAHLLVGSKAEQVVRMAKIPVTIVKATRENNED